MRKQTDFVVRVWDMGNGANGSKTGEVVSKEIRDVYLRNGYEIFSTPGALQISAGVIYFAVCFVKYEDVAEPSAKPK